jgi:undecaprenyl-diphosphatase
MRLLGREPRPSLALASMLAGVVVLLAAVTLGGFVGRLDLGLLAAVQAGAGEWATDGAVAITMLGGTNATLLVTVLGCALLLILRHWRGAVALAFSVVATNVVVNAVKLTVSRPRPDADEALIQAGGFSFPSGHAAIAVALYATLGYVLARRCTGSVRAGVIAGTALVVAAVGMSRVYLGVHYPTDVLAGWLTGGAIVLASWMLVARLGLPNRAAPTAA